MSNKKKSWNLIKSQSLSHVPNQILCILFISRTFVTSPNLAFASLDFYQYYPPTRSTIHRLKQSHFICAFDQMFNKWKKHRKIGATNVESNKMAESFKGIKWVWWENVDLPSIFRLNMWIHNMVRSFDSTWMCEMGCHTFYDTYYSIWVCVCVVWANNWFLSNRQTLLFKGHVPQSFVATHSFVAICFGLFTNIFFLRLPFDRNGKESEGEKHCILI